MSRLNRTINSMLHGLILHTMHAIEQNSIEQNCTD